MSKWWELPYKGGPMVDVPGFPRPLYPPDSAPNYQPSIDGPDVIAYKRTVSRLGRWPWDTFDDSFSNGFSHGKSGGNVATSGIAGVQRQANIQATGFVGKETFNLLRSARVPEGLMHAGEMAMDAKAQSLIVDAWNEFHGKPANDGGTSANERMQNALSFLGVKESPAGSNHTKFGEWYGMDYQPWCGQFATYCDQVNSARPSRSFVRGKRYAYVPYIVGDAQHKLYGLSVTKEPRYGDMVCFNWDGGEYDHVGFFEAWVSGKKGKTFTTIEGNTSIDSNSNGGQVMRRTRDVSVGAPIFVRVAE